MEVADSIMELYDSSSEGDQEGHLIDLVKRYCNVHQLLSF